MKRKVRAQPLVQTQCLRLKCFEHTETILDADLVQNPVDVIFYSLFGQVELIGDFLVGHPTVDERDKLLFASSQTHLRVDPAVGR